jgi:hypothetical protein
MYPVSTPYKARPVTADWFSNEKLLHVGGVQWDNALFDMISDQSFMSN